MLNLFYVKKFFIFLILLIITTGCAETQLAVHTAKKITTFNKEKDAHRGKYKVGNPYQIKGIWYYPTVNYRYEQTGIASWYGPNFNGKKTANGEVFDMNKVSAAHRTLPMPSVVRVTNLRNGRVLKIRINDRGPFAHGRIIDLSRRAAQLLGFMQQGTAPVKVIVLENESRIEALRAKGAVKRLPAIPTRNVEMAFLPNERNNSTFKVSPPQKTSSRKYGKLDEANKSQITVKPYKKVKIFIQAGAFIKKHRAVVLKYLLERYGFTRVMPAKVGKQLFYRVQIGPIASVIESDRILKEVISRGYPNAKVIVN